MILIRLITGLAVATCLMAGCTKQEVTVERSEKTDETPKANLDGVWRSLGATMAFRVLPEGKADFYPGSNDEIFSATYSNASGRLRMEVASPLMRTVENFIVRGDQLEHEASGATFFREDEFLKKWLGTEFADQAVVGIPTPGESFYIRTEQEQLWQPEEHTFGAGYLEILKQFVNDQVVLSSLTPKGKNRWNNNAEEYQCSLNAQAASLPKAKNIRPGLIGIQWGSYDVQAIKGIDASKANPDVKIITGTHKFRPNALGERMMALSKESVRSEYKFKAAVRTPRTIAKQPWLNAWDWGYADESGYKTSNVQQAYALQACG